jgi:hypothetical protein
MKIGEMGRTYRRDKLLMNVFKISIAKPQWRRLPERCKGQYKMDLRYVRCEDVNWTKLVQDGYFSTLL